MVRTEIKKEKGSRQKNAQWRNLAVQLRGKKRHSKATVSETTSTANTVEVGISCDADRILRSGGSSSTWVLVFVRAGEIVVDDNVHLGDIHTTSANVGGNKNLDLIGLEFVVRFGTAKTR